MGLRLPVLRSPAFPGVAAEQAAVGVPRITRADGIIPADPRRIRPLIDQIVRSRVGGTFWAPAAAPARVVLRPADPAMADAMAAAARATADPADILAMLPAAPWAAPAKRALAAAGIAATVGETDPWPSLETAQAVHAAGDDEFALLALLAGVAVHCHGDGPIAGRGLTRDDPAIAAKPAATLEQLAAALLIDPVSYRDPFTESPATAEDAVATLAFWRGLIDANRGIAAGAGIAAWKRPEVAGMLWAGDARPLRFHRRAAPVVAVAAAAGATCMRQHCTSRSGHRGRTPPLLRH